MTPSQAVRHSFRHMTGFHISSFSFIRSLVYGKSPLPVGWQGSRVVLGADMKPKAPGSVAPCLVDGPLEKVPPQALANEFRHQSKLHQFDFAFAAPVQLGNASGYAVGHQDVDFEPGIMQ